MRKYLLTTLFVALAVSACGDSSGPGTASVIGTYTLVSVNGQPPPVVMYEDEFWKDEWLSGAIVLSAGGSCSITIQWRETEKDTGEVETGTETYPCTYTVSGSTITFSFFGETLQGTISGNTLTITEDGDVLVFRK